MKRIQVLFIGESWFIHTMESKGFDVFTYEHYEEATKWIKKAIESDEISFTHIPCHLVDANFPKTMQELKEYDVIMFSDIGANTFLIPMETFLGLHAMPNKLEMVKEFVKDGGGFAMIGGYLTYQGIQGRGCYKGTVIEEILPVTLQASDDRIECCQGVTPYAVMPEHAVMKGLPKDGWPDVFGYNKVTAKADSEVVAKVNDDVMIALREYGAGRTLSYTTDCAPHWSPLEFCEWDGYRQVWQNLVKWLAHKS